MSSDDTPIATQPQEAAGDDGDKPSAADVETVNTVVPNPDQGCQFISSHDIDAVYHQMGTVDGKTPMTFGPMLFWPSLLIGVPMWLTVLVPFAIVASSFQMLWVVASKQLFPPPPKSALPSEEEDEDKFEITPREQRKYDVVLLGATGFTGRLAVNHLARQYGAAKNSKVQWAIAGRSKSKLEQLLRAVAEKTSNKNVLDVDIFIVDTSDKATVKPMVENTRAVITSAGPFAKYGSPVVELCAKYGTHYADITGEVDWNKLMMNKYESQAKATGAKIVSFCGHDSIPWDLTVRFLSDKLEQECNDHLVSVECMDDSKGNVSGGTLATIYYSLEEAVKEVELSSFTAPQHTKLDTYMRLPDGSESSYKTLSDIPLIPTQLQLPRFQNQWCGPFFMAVVNLEIVRRSVALAKNGVPVLRYREVLVGKDFMDAFVMWFSTALLLTLVINPVTRKLVKKVLPQPGEGPTEKEMTEGYLLVSGYGVGEKGNVVESAMYFPRDGGYTSTAVMLVESGLCLALDEKLHVEEGGGFYTPAAIMCDSLLGRLVNVGTHFACKVVKK